MRRPVQILIGNIYRRKIGENLSWFRIDLAGLVKSMNDSWKNMIQSAALLHGADPERACVWELFSNLFLDTCLSHEMWKEITKGIAETRFSIPELVHIYRNEVSPVCDWNIFMWEWGGFDPDWLIPRCLKRQRSSPYSERSKQHHIPPFSFSFTYFDACEMFEDIKQFRRTRKR